MVLNITDVLCVAEVPHSTCGAVLEVLQQLRNPKHGLKEDSQRAQRLHEQHRVEEEEGDEGTQECEAEAEDQVVLEARPTPEVTQVKI